jgi:hypothetical protein
MAGLFSFAAFSGRFTTYDAPPPSRTRRVSQGGFMHKLRAVLFWIVQVWVTFGFLAIGFAKFHNPFWIRAFARWGYSDAFRILIGVLEMAAGVLLAIPPARIYAAGLVDVIMIGALGTILVHAEPRAELFAPIFWIATVSAFAYARRRDAWRPTGRGSVAADAV